MHVFTHGENVNVWFPQAPPTGQWYHMTIVGEAWFRQDGKRMYKVKLRSGPETIYHAWAKHIEHLHNAGGQQAEVTPKSAENDPQKLDADVSDDELTKRLADLAKGLKTSLVGGGGLCNQFEYLQQSNDTKSALMKIDAEERKGQLEKGTEDACYRLQFRVLLDEASRAADLR